MVFVQMESATQSNSTRCSIYAFRHQQCHQPSAIEIDDDQLHSRVPCVGRHENESVDYYARICGCSSGAMSKRLNELDEMSSRDRSKAGYGLLEGPAEPDGSKAANDQVVTEGSRAS
jgi:hypothetical protein